MSDSIDNTQNLIISYTINKTNKQLSFPVSYNNIDINNDVDVKSNKMLKDSKGNATIDNFSTGDAGSTFDFTILTDNVDDIKALNTLYLNVTPFTIVLPASILLKTISNNTRWIIEDKDQSQDNRDYVVIKLKLHTYNPPKKITLLDTSLATLGNKFNKNCVKKNVDLNSKKAFADNLVKGINVFIEGKRQVELENLRVTNITQGDKIKLAYTKVGNNGEMTKEVRKGQYRFAKLTGDFCLRSPQKNVHFLSKCTIFSGTP